MKKKLKLLGLLLITNVLVYSQSTPIVFTFEYIKSIQPLNNETKNLPIPSTVIFHNNNLDIQFNQDTLSFGIFEGSYEVTGIKNKEQLRFDIINKETKIISKAYLSSDYFIVEELNQIFIFHTK